MVSWYSIINYSRVCLFQTLKTYESFHHSLKATQLTLALQKVHIEIIKPIHMNWAVYSKFEIWRISIALYAEQI